MQTKLYFFTKNTYATWSRLSRLDYHSVTTRLPFGYHSQRHRRGTAKKIGSLRGGSPFLGLSSYASGSSRTSGAR